MPCFGDGKCSREHKPPTHPFRVIEQHSIPIFTDDWGADEEALLLEGAETYGLGSWADIADHIGGMREKDEVRKHYINSYINSPAFPLPEHASPADRTIMDRWPREEFQARKKRRIEDRKEAAKSAPPAPPKTKPTSSVPSCHEVQGFMPGRLEFETEHLNEAEEAVQSMAFEPGEGINPVTGELDAEMNLKMTVMGIYNARLTARTERKKFIFEHELLEYRKITATEKKKTKDERELLNRMKPLARLMRKDDFDQFAVDVEYELNLRQAIAQLQDWRVMSVESLKAGEKYEQDKAARAVKIAAQNAYDRFAANRQAKPAPPNETNPAVSNLTAPEFTPRPTAVHSSPNPANSVAPGDKSKVLTNGSGNVNGAVTAVPHRPKFSMPALSNVTPLKLESEHAPDLHLLTQDEKELCTLLRLMPKSYIAIKDNVLREASKHGGYLKKKTVKEICRIDATKGGRIFDFFVHSGWMSKA